MKKPVLLLLSSILLLLPFQGRTQDQKVFPTLIRSGVFLGETKPLRDMPALTPDQVKELAKKKMKAKRELNEELESRSYPFAETALPKGNDPAWQSSMGSKSALSNAPIQNFAGQTSPYYPPDCNGAAGPNHYMQTINCTYAIYNKTGTLLAGPTNMNLLFGSVTGSSYNDGDPIVLYDEQAQRFLAAEFSISGSNDYMLVAVSSSSDPTGTWYQYSFDVADMPDYPKFGIWQDGYYLADNNSSGNDIYVLQRSVMLTGGSSPKIIGFDNPYRPTSIDGFMCVPPVDNDGTFAPAGSPGIFIAFNDDAIAGGSDQLWIYELAANWTTPASSTFSRVQQLNVAAFDSNFGNDWTNIAQPGTSQQLDAIPQVIMNVPQYRNFGTYQTLVCCHTVDVDATDHAGVRWYELRRGTQTSGNWAVRQQGTYAPDSHSRWMGSIMLNSSGQLALGYSISSSTVYPGIRYTGQSSSAYAGATGTMDIAEQTIQTGAASQTGAERWGDYSLMCVDPSDNQTFWFTSEYISGSSRVTKIASFKFGNSPVVVTTAATAIAPASATLNGTVNPNGLSTTYYFEYGTTTSYGSLTTTTSAGSGSSAVAVSAGITGLTAGTTYHFRIVATNSDGTSYGSDLTFTPGGAIVSTTAASAVTLNSATSGGNVTSDGGSTVTAKGVCWSTSANPTISGSHTTDGSGLGAFTSSITGLSSSTTYHIRAYATNTYGTFYGEDLTFTTLCGTIASFPWNEGFENGGSIPSCWSQEQVSSSGLNWTFITGNGGSYPSAAHGGTYNACLKDATSAANITKLITPTLNLSGISSPTLTFWHYMQKWGGDQDELIIYYRTSSTGTWTSLATYTSSVTSWTQRTISLPNTTSDYYIAFEGNAKYGYGVCIDDVSITGSAAPTLAVAPSSQNVAALAGNTSFTVTSNSNWTVSSDQTWCTVTPSGSGNGTITATYTQNTTSASRTANITVTVTGLTPVAVTVVQAAPILTVSPSNQPVTSDAGATSFTVTSNSAWTASSDQSWCTVTASGSGDGSITANYTANSTLTTRIATITVTVSGITPVTVTVTQAGLVPSLSVAPSNQSVTSAAGSTSFTVTSNTGWTASSDQTWCSVTPSGSGNGTISASYSENTVTSVRVATITVTASGTSPVSVTVTQDAATVPEFLMTLANDVQTSPYTFEFDLLLWDNIAATPFELATIQGAILVNPAIYNGGTVTASIVAGTSTLNAAQQPNSITFAQASNIIKLASKAPPGAGNGTILSTNPSNPNRVCRIKLTNTVPWATQTANLTFNFSTTPYATKISQYIGGINTPLTTNSTNCYSVCSNILLNPPPTLAVTPPNQTVTAPAGSTTFSIVSNAAWTAVSDQSWCTVTPSSGWSTGTLTASFDENTSAAQRIANITVTVNGLTPVVVTVTQNGVINKTLNLSVFLQGLYGSPGMMNPAMDENGIHWGANIADKITVEFHDSVDYNSLVYSLSNVDLQTDGTASLTFPAALSGSYYITIRHRNSIETVSAFPVSFAGSSVTYLFDSAAKAYGSNMYQAADGTWMIWGGDPNQDGLVDASDMVLIDNDAAVFVTGYIVNDLNGDGLIDSSDMVLLDNNASMFVARVIP